MKLISILKVMMVAFAIGSCTKLFSLQEPINVLGNTVGIKSGSSCHLVSNSPAGGSMVVEESIVCLDAEGGQPEKVFKLIGTVIGSATGTPPWLEYSNYIGQAQLPSEGKGLGATKRIIYCDGPCHKR